VVWPPFFFAGDPDWERLGRERPDLVAGIEADRRMRWANAANGQNLAEDDYPCLWLDRETGRCRHYDYRPSTCRDFEPGSSDCEFARGQFGLEALTIGAPLPAPAGRRAGDD
jgi:Fe-S-cluster containining protein